jgi:hypothetical protein
MLFVCKKCFKSGVGSMLHGAYVGKGHCQCCDKTNVRLYTEVIKPELPSMDNIEIGDYKKDKPNMGLGIFVLLIMIAVTVWFYIKHFGA